MANKIKLKKGDVDDFYEPSESDEEYTEREKSLLKKVRKNNKRHEDSEEEILAFDDDEDEVADGNEDFDEDNNSDFDEEERNANGGIPDSRAWGKKRRDFYSTDFVDQDYSSYNANEEQLAEQEESEARAIQQRLAKQLDEADFTLDVYASATATTKSDTNETQIHLQSDLTDLSHRQRVQLFRKDSPEFDGLVQDFEQRLEESIEVLEPIVDYFRQHGLTELPIFEFVATKNKLILTYCSNVAFYLVLKAKRVSIKNHPLVKRLVQMRQLLLQLEDKYERVVRPQLEQILEHIANGDELTFQLGAEPIKKPRKKAPKLKFLSAMERNGQEDEASGSSDDEETLPSVGKEKTASDSEEDEEAMEEDVEEMGEDDERRHITYQISKNKGLTPHRKKELRNPRVKHRNKFRKAIIRRKGAVRTVRKEDKRYSGEVSGIKASTKKGIKIK